MYLSAEGLKEGSPIDILIKRDGATYKITSYVVNFDEDKLYINPISSKKGLFQFKFTDSVDMIYRFGAQTFRWNNVKPSLFKTNDGTLFHTFAPTQRAVLTNRRNTYRLTVSMRIKITYEYKADIEAADERERLLKEAAMNQQAQGVQPTEQPEEKKTGASAIIFGSAKIEEPKPAEKPKPNVCFAYINDLSEGGASISADIKLDIGDQIGFTLEYKNEEVSAKGTVVRVIDEDSKRGKYQYGLRYFQTSKNYVQFLFNEQRKYINDMKK